MKKTVALLILMLIPFLLGAEHKADTKPLVTVKLKDGSTMEFKFDTITDTQVIGLEKGTLKPIRLNREKVVSIHFGGNQTPKLGAGVEGVVLTDDSVVRGDVVAIDENTITLRGTGAKDEVIDRPKVAIIELATKPKDHATNPQPGLGIPVSVPATAPWTDTGIAVKQGDQIWVTAAENAMIGCNPQAPQVNADGVNPLVRDPNRPIPDVKACALIGRVGNTPFRIGLNRTPITAQESGTLQLGINDYQFADNTGQFVVTVKKGGS